MNIIKATKQAIEKGCGMKRESWEYEIIIYPMKTCYDVLIKHEGKEERHRNWNSQIDDVLADDWSLVE